MKKVILTLVSILFVALFAVSAVACNNATTQGQLEDIWYDYESYVYDVNDGTNVGEYSVAIKWYGEGDVTVGATTLKNPGKGYLVTGKLTIAGAQYDTSCFFKRVDGNTFLVPVASYRKQVNPASPETNLEINGTYDGSTFNYSGVVAGENKQGSIGLSAPYYDNNEFHQVLRSVSTMSTGFSFSFKVPVVANEIGAVSLTASCASTEKITAPVKDGEIDCYNVTISRSTKVDGKKQRLYYATSPLELDTDGDGAVDYKPKKALIKIVEPTADGEVTYTLKSATFTE